MCWAKVDCPCPEACSLYSGNQFRSSELRSTEVPMHSPKKLPQNVWNQPSRWLFLYTPPRFRESAQLSGGPNLDDTNLRSEAFLEAQASKGCERSQRNGEHSETDKSCNFRTKETLWAADSAQASRKAFLRLPVGRCFVHFSRDLSLSHSWVVCCWAWPWRAEAALLPRRVGREMLGRHG